MPANSIVRGALGVVILIAMLADPVAITARRQAPVGSFAVVDVGVVSDHSTSVAWAIDEEGRFVGFSMNDEGVSRAFLGDAEGELRDLGSQGERSIAVDVGDDGRAVGMIRTLGPTSAEDGPMRAAVWTDGEAAELPTLGGDHSQATAINGEGIVVGSAASEPGTDAVGYACRWQDGVAENLGTLGGYSIANDVNDRGWIVGGSGGGPDGSRASVVGAGARAVLWRDGELVVLGTLGGDISQARSINEGGQIVGYATTGPDQVFSGRGMHAFLWEDGEMVDLGTLPGSEIGLAFAVNEVGQAVGASTAVDAPAYVTGGFAAVLWQDGTIVDLNTLIPVDSGWWLSTAYGINDAGQIVGTGYLYGRLRGFVLTPTIS